ncbi:MAG: DUF4093 domain-containing protein [Oscillospiraceae bacterium]|nr:DUF4093 domain-containing protein [Oscillospiraceae bacterium]
MIKLSQAIVVEGRYDRMKLSTLFDAPIVETGGFNLFHSEQTQALIRHFANTTGIILLTDSDPAGHRIRAFVNQLAKDGCICNAYVPQLAGKERRKTHAGAAGLLGVEGVPDEVIVKAVQDALQGMQPQQNKQSAAPVTAAELYEAGLSGRADSVVKRAAFLNSRGLPTDLSVKQMLRYLHAVPGPEALRDLLKNI